MPRRKEGEKLKSDNEDEHMPGVMSEDEEETVEMDTSPAAKMIGESLEKLQTMTPSSLRSVDSLEDQSLANSKL